MTHLFLSQHLSLPCEGVSNDRIHIIFVKHNILQDCSLPREMIPFWASDRHEQREQQFLL